MLHYNALHWSLHCTVLQFIQFSASYYWTDRHPDWHFPENLPVIWSTAANIPVSLICEYSDIGARWVKWVAGNLKLIFTLGNWATIGHWFMNRQWWMIRRQLCPDWPKQALYTLYKYKNTNKKFHWKYTYKYRKKWKLKNNSAQCWMLIGPNLRDGQQCHDLMSPNQ